jgi:hypothetical protein
MVEEFKCPSVGAPFPVFTPDFPFSSGTTPLQPNCAVLPPLYNINLLHQTKQQSKMKTLTIIITAVLALQVNILLAGNAISLPATAESSTITLSSLAPTAPMEATFDDASLTNDYAALVPIIPMEASFEDAAAEQMMLINIAPVIPTVAGFDDEVMIIDYSSLTPVVPVEADFE